MNSLQGEIEKIDTSGLLSIIYVRLGEYTFSSIVIETADSADYLQVGKIVKVLFKETEVIISKEFLSNTSLQNSLACEIQSVETGKILSKVVLNSKLGIFSSVITSKACSDLCLAVGDEVFAMVKTNEIMLKE